MQDLSPQNCAKTATCPVFQIVATHCFPYKINPFA